MPQAGLFLCHTRGERVLNHFARLQRESWPHCAWTLVYNPGNGCTPDTDFAMADVRSLMGNRYREMVANGGVIGGFVDVLIMGAVLGLGQEVTWIIEYDVDFSGRWGDFFAPFCASTADLLLSKITPRAELPNWHHWRSARSPREIAEDKHVRGFHPLMRVTRNFAERYCRTVAGEDWGGHAEFTLPTVAVALGATLEDLGGAGVFTPAERKDRHYTADTFRWRPPRPFYFAEAPQAFALTDHLYHPVKPEVAGWERDPVRRLQARLRGLIGDKRPRRARVAH